MKQESLSKQVLKHYRFEFRGPGSRQSIGGVNIVLNTIVAQTLTEFAEELEGSTDIAHDALNLAIKTFKKHHRIFFNGNGYSDEWIKEAELRGLPNLKTTPDALPHFKSDKSVKLFEAQGVFSRLEVETRGEIMMEEYNKTLHIEMLTMLEMAKQEILPACLKYTKSVAEGVAVKKSLCIDAPNEEKAVRDLTAQTEKLMDKISVLDKAYAALPSDNAYDTGMYYKDTVIPAMEELRKTADELEAVVGKDFWPFPTYTDLLYSI